MAYAQINSLSLTEGRLLEGEKGLAYQCMLAILHFVFPPDSFFPSSLFCYFFVLFPVFFFFISFLVLTHVVYSDVVIFSHGSYYPHTMHDKGPLYTACRDQVLPFQSSTTFVQVQVSLLTTISLLVVQPPSLTCVGCHSPSLDKEDYLVCLLTVAFLSTLVWVLSLYPLWHAPSGFNSSLLLLGGKSSQHGW